MVLPRDHKLWYLASARITNRGPSPSARITNWGSLPVLGPQIVVHSHEGSISLRTQHEAQCERP